MSPSLPSVVPYCHSTVAELVEREKEETNRLLRGDMDRLVNSLFLRLTNKLLMNTDWAESENVGDCSQVVIPSDHIQSLNTEIHQSSSLIAQTSTLNPDYLQPHSIGQEEYGSEIITEVKREGEHEISSMTLKNIQDNTTKTTQFVTRRPSTDNNHLFYEMDSTLGDEQLSNQPIDDERQPNGQCCMNMNNATDKETQQDLEEHEIEEGDDKQIMQVEEDGDETEIDSDNGEFDNEDAYRIVEKARTDNCETILPHHNGQTEGIPRRSVRNMKQKQTDEGDYLKEMEKEDEDDQVDDESSRPVKRTRMDTTQPNNSIGEESIATESITNPIQPNRQFQCPHCHKSCQSRCDLTKHLRVHTGERPFQCDQCGKRFSVKCNLTKHQLIHQNIKRFRCDLCGKHFSEKASLERHQLIHQNIKNFRCSQCGKQFNRKDQLDRHLLTHSGERPFECRHCEMSFTELTTRNRHEQAIHLHVKPYRCKQCGLTVTLRSIVIRHIRVNHFGLPRTIKEQQALNIIDERDPKELIEKV